MEVNWRRRFVVVVVITLEDQITTFIVPACLALTQNTINVKLSIKISLFYIHGMNSIIRYIH